MERAIAGSRLLSSATHGKQLFFHLDRGFLGIHLGMTGKLAAESRDFQPDKHDHLVFVQATRTLVFSDPRLFGRVLFHADKTPPAWWTDRSPDLLSKDFTVSALRDFLARRKNSPVKAVLLMQERFPGIGNWMADEILWRARILPSRRAGTLRDDANLLWKTVRAVCREALHIIGRDFSDPPDTWLFNHRWENGGACPRCGIDLKRATVGGRTSCWCPRCQR